MTDAELVQAIADAKRDLWQARFELSTRQLKDTSVVNKTRKTIARLLMVLAERQAAQKA
jgi:ribosomal protein L29